MVEWLAETAARSTATFFTWIETEMVKVMQAMESRLHGILQEIGEKWIMVFLDMIVSHVKASISKTSLCIRTLRAVSEIS